MKRDNVLGICVISFSLLLILSVFLPYINYFSKTISFWDLESISRVIYILLGLFVIVLYIINKKTEMSYLAVGYIFFNSIETIIEVESLSSLSIGFYLILVSAILISILTILYREDDADALIGKIEND